MNGGVASNPPCGTVVDDVVTRPERYDFFLVSQNVKEGTVNPTMYNVIKDESGLSPDNIQALTFKVRKNISGSCLVKMLIAKKILLE